MAWVWQQNNWPDFEFDPQKLLDYELEFQHNAGKITGAIQHLEESSKDILRVEILSQEAISTSNIEGEVLNRDSVQSSIRRHLGLKTDFRKVPPNEAGIAEMMVDLYLHFQDPLSHEILFEWHKMLMNGRRDIEAIGNYRQHEEPMQIVSGNLGAPKVFYEAPPSASVFEEMEDFITWYNAHAESSKELSTLAFAGIAHMRFEMIHPFEDGNGRTGRALVEKAISQRLKAPALNSFAKMIDLNKKAYYHAIQAGNTQLAIDDYLDYFARLTLQAQDYSIRTVYFLIEKAKFFLKHQSQLNERQAKVLLRVFDAGVEGFKGGLSAQNYKSITGASPATVTRDLQDLVQMGALQKTGELKHTRYALNFSSLL